MKLRIPETTEEQPYIEFRFNKKGKLISLNPCGAWWGGITHGFVSTDGTEGNVCLPKDLEKFIKAYKARKVNQIQKEINSLTDSLKNWKP